MPLRCKGYLHSKNVPRASILGGQICIFWLLDRVEVIFFTMLDITHWIIRSSEELLKKGQFAILQLQV